MGTDSQAIADVIAERKRQVEVEGWTAEHDDEHMYDELAEAAACYAMPEERRSFYLKTDARSSGRGLADPDDIVSRRVPLGWPRSWACWWWKPKTRREDLVRAAALIIAEIERLDRAGSRHD